jgi:hypothetical protein
MIEFMSSENPDAETIAMDEVEGPATENTLTLRSIALAIVSGQVGLIVMAPTLVGIPVVLDVFRAEPLVEFANIGSFFGITPSLVGPVLGFDPNLVVGGLIFALGGILFLPVQFLVVATFLPPESPRYARGGSFAMLWWGGFVFAFWPAGTIAINALFVVLSALSHILYGLTLGYLIHRLDGIPQHSV